MRTLATLLLLFGVAAAQDLGSELARVVDLETPRERRAAAAELALRKDVSLDAWLGAMRAFGTFTTQKLGSHTGRVRLRVGRKVEDTEITVYVPLAYKPTRPAPLLMAFHFTGSNGRSMPGMWRTTADKLGMIVVCPSEAGPNVGYGFTERERLAAMAALRWARRRYNIDENRIYLNGSGRGGHMTWDLALRMRDRFAAIAVHGGAPCMVTSKGANNLRYLRNIVDLPVVCLIGVAGKRRRIFDTVPPVFTRLEGLGAPHARLIERERIGTGGLDWATFFTKARPARPRRVVRAYARRGEGRAFWVEVLAANGWVKENFDLVATPAEAKRLDDDGYLRFMQKEADEKTAHLDVEWLGGPHFLAKATGVRSFRLLLDRAMLADAIHVSFDGKARRYEPRASARVLLREFAERFDRTFLPVAEVRVH